MYLLLYSTFTSIHIYTNINKQKINVITMILILMLILGFLHYLVLLLLIIYYRLIDMQNHRDVLLGFCVIFLQIRIGKESKVTAMQTRNGRQYLPQTYESFQAIRKKNTKITSLTIKALASVHNNSGFGQYFQEIPKQLKKHNEIKQAESDQQNTPITSLIVERTVYSDYQKMFDQFQNCKFEAISNKISKEMEKLKEQTPIRNVNVNTILKDLSIQSLENLVNLQKQLKANTNRRNLQKIDSMLAFNKFFVILNKEKRFRIYDHCQFMIVEEGQEIYRDGDVEDFMYVVIKGCVKQHQKKQTSYHQKITVNFISHYEGSNFGEAQLVGEKNQKAKRHHSAIASQKSYLLKINNQFYKDLITNSAEDDFEKKLSALLSTSIFSETSKIFVTPLLSTLEKKTLNFGQVLIRQGQPVKKLYFIGQGNLQIIFVSRQKRSIKHLNIEQKPKNFVTRGSTSQNKARDKNYSIHQSFYISKQQDFDPNKQFVYGKKKVVGNELEYNDQVVFEELRHGSFLGGKSFLTPEQRQKKSDTSQYFQPTLQAKLTVVASTLFTTVYSIDQKKFFSLSDNVQKVIIEGIMNTTYFDERNIQNKITAHQEWKKYSQNLVAKVIKQKKSRNQSFRL